jgi:transcriptional regulator with XRE-family HTH domain
MCYTFDQAWNSKCSVHQSFEARYFPAWYEEKATMDRAHPLLKKERLRLSLSQAELAERVGTTPSNVSRWERGKTSPTPHFRHKLSDLFQLPPEVLFPDMGGVVSAVTTDVFWFNMDLKEASECYGYTREKMTLLSRASRGEATSIVGPRRIGKTWLMKYLKLVAPARMGTQVHVGYLDVTAPSCATLAGFTGAALKALEITVPASVGQEASPLVALERGVIDLRAREQIPILCIDEFEHFCRYDAQRGIVLEHLRAVSQAGLGLVVASKQPLIEIVDKVERTSPFFNICRQVSLHPFSRREAEGFAQDKAAQAGWSEEERDYLLAYAREPDRDVWFPLRLQLVGTLLHEDKMLAELEHPDFYRPQDADYWQEFVERVDEIYQGVVR